MPDYWVDHIHFFSDDPQKTADFYLKMLGATKTGDRQLPDGRTMITIDLNGTAIFISQPKARDTASGAPPAEIGLDHVGIKTENLEAAIAELKSKGAKFTVEPVAGNAGAAVSFFLAPDNSLLELQQGKKP